MPESSKHITLKLLIIILLLILSCGKENEEVFNGIFSKNGSLATILTTPATSVTDTSAEAGGNLTDNGSTYIIVRGICWSTDQNPDTSDFKIETGKEPGEFTCSITGLSKGTVYYMRAYVSNNIGTAYGNQETFTTLNIPTITTASISNITDTTAISGGNITADGGVNITARGVCWSTKQNPTIADTISKDGSGKGIFTSSLKRLVPNTTYFVRAYATNIVGTAYGNELVFATTSATTGLPVISTTEITDVTQTTAISGGNITSAGVSNVTARGVCWGISPSPTISNSIASGGLGNGSFSSAITGLNPGTLYYVRAYATNTAGTAYGNELSFTTLSPGGATVTDIDGNVYNTITIGTQIWMKENLKTTRYRDGSAIPNITDNTAWGNLTSGAYCWYNNDQAAYKATYGALYNFYTTTDSRNLCPTGWHVPTHAEWTTLTTYLGGENVAGGKMKSVSGWTIPNTGASNVSEFTALPGGYRYYIGGSFNNLGGTGDWWTSTVSTTAEAFSRRLNYSEMGVSWGVPDFRNGYSVRCLQGEMQYLPTVSTTSVSAVTQTTATAGGNITNNGGAAITTRGVCWSSLPAPTIALTTKTSDGSGSGSFTSSITGLSPGTIYYVRAYATNSVGTAYGNELSFTTGSGAPTGPSLTTTQITSITQTTASSGGSITTDGGANITAKGVCWSTSQNPTIALTTKTIDGTGTGTFSSSITGLTANTKYYVRAYATNSISTSYGNEISFTTSLVSTGTVTDIDGNKYDTVYIGTQTWLKQNLKTTRYRDGTAIPNMTTNPGWSSNGASFTGAYCWHNNDINNKNEYGALYNYYTVVDGHKLCPFGWHVPKVEEWTTLINNLGGTANAGGALKEAGFTHWLNPNLFATNSSSFTALPGDQRFNDGTMMSLGSNGNWWSSSPSVFQTDSAYRYNLNYNSSYIISNPSAKSYGYSVRCIQGEGIVLPVISPEPTMYGSSTTGISGGNITSDGGSPVTVRGLCYSTGINPTTALATKTINGSGTGAYTTTITGLNPNTTYYVRAYATNSVGTAYATQVSFTTPSSTVPVITTTSISAVTSSSASSGGTISSNGGSAITESGVIWSLSPNPTIALTTRTTTSSTTSFTSSLTGLTPSTTYYVRAYATNNTGTGYGNEVTFTTLTATGGTVTDIDGNVYNTVIIGTQTWMAENLKTTKYRDGSSITNITDNIAWGLLTSGAYCWYNNDQATYKASFGALYNFYTTVDNRNLCPTGWHVPTDAEWTTLATFLGGESIAGGKLKEAGTIHWMSPNTGATNETGFNGLPWSYREKIGAFQIIGYGAYWWSSTQSTSNTGWGRNLTSTSTYINRSSYYPENGFYIRCLQGEGQVLPAVTTNTTTVTNTSISTGGNVTSDGGSSVTERGICWSTTLNPTIELSSKISSGTGTGNFYVGIPLLTPLTTFYFRAYATNSVGTAYGANETVTTGTGIPPVTTTAITGITTNSAISGGDVGSSGGETATTRGVCWSTSVNPTVTDSKTIDGSGNGSFVSNITGLSPGTTYHVRAYATNNNGIGYGSDVSFTTNTDLPTVTTTAVTSIIYMGATSGGNVTWDGGSTLYSRGVCWNTTGNPTIADSKTVDGTGTGTYTSTITGLIPSTTYHVRAYATNSAGTSYGADLSFTTTDGLPTATTSPISGITTISAVSGGDVTCPFGPSITARGICWGTTTNPAITGNKTTDGSGSGGFTSSLTGLTANTTYYVRAYATNILGTTYGNEITFTTNGTVTDIEGNIYNTISIGTQIWIKENLKTTKYNDGTKISKVTDNTAWAALTTPSFCWYSNDSVTYKATYGALYNWYAIDVTINGGRNVCPVGWHVPTDAQWTTLSTYLGGESIAGGKLKETGTTHWATPNNGATNETGFTALPGGARYGNGLFGGTGTYGDWWSSKEFSVINSYFINMYNDLIGLYAGNDDKRNGFSVRCLKD
ncbi:MAG: fibrobacter succinogenes major paralogous domain-containing protein [Bacteroidales bacterium]|nr:fibrobacter succinogenes major paralogous domain-containing protein [Bacteroidales bacterium]